MVENSSMKLGPCAQLKPEILFLEYVVCNHNFQKLCMTSIIQASFDTHPLHRRQSFFKEGCWINVAVTWKSVEGTSRRPAGFQPTTG